MDFFAAVPEPDEIDKHIEAHMLRRHVPGLSLAMVRGGSVVKERSYGLANVELGAPATKVTVYEIGSMTKMFTATAIMLLAGEGKIGLDEPITTYRGGLPAEWDRVTVRHLLSHTSGVPRERIDFNRPDLTVEEIEQVALLQPLRFTPGERFEYTDRNYNLLGMLIHRITGMPYDQLLQQRVFGPLRMEATRHNAVQEIVPNRAGGYEWEDGRLLNSYRIPWNYVNISPDVPSNGANGSLLSSVADLITWDAALRAGRVFERSVLEQMWEPGRLTSGEAVPYGLGWELGEHQGRRLAEHGGGIPGFTTSFVRFLDDDLTVIILTNQDAKPWDLARAVAGLYEPSLA